MEIENKAYLGDGLYAENDSGFMIKLSADRYGGEVHWVGLEPFVFAELCRFAIRMGWGSILRDSLRKEKSADELSAD